MSAEAAAGPPQQNAALGSGSYVFVFTDLVNSTSLTHALPPQVWRPARDAFFALQGQIARAHHLLWLSPRGDGKFLVFADATDAARFAATLLAAVLGRDWGGVPISVRVGIAAGYADFLPTEAGGVQDDFVGHPLNLAARLCGVARPNEVLLASQAHAGAEALTAQTGDAVRFTDLGEVELRGLPPERAYRLVAPGLPQDFPPLAPRGNLERFQAYSRYFGREADVAEAEAVLTGAAQPVLTVLGDPGQGKTRLALEVGQRARPAFVDGVWFVPLEDVRAGARAPEAVAGALDVVAPEGGDVGPALIEHLRRRRLLLILDNCEQLLADPGDEGLLEFLEQTVRACPQVRILATSRQALELGVQWERELRLEALPLPPDGDGVPIERLGECASVQLLCDRLTLAGTRFALDAGTAPHVVAICRALDGVPLYLELAAGQVGHGRTLPQIAADVYSLLHTRDRAYRPRQRTLEALLDWSCDLMPQERAFFFRLGVFAGGFRAEDAAAVCDESDADARLRFLALRSLVRSDAAADYLAAIPRYRLLQAPAAYARQRLGGELPRWQRRHAEYYLAFARARDDRLRGASQKQAGGEMFDALPNLRLGMDWALGAGEDALACAYGLALSQFLYTRGLAAEGRERLRTATDAARRLGEAGTLARCLTESARFTLQQGDASAARQILRESLRLWPAQADGLLLLGSAEARLGRGDGAERLYERALGLARGAGDPWGEAECRQHLGLIEYDRGRFDRAREQYQEALRLRQQAGDWGGAADSLVALGEVAMVESDYAAAWACFTEALTIKRDLRDNTGEAYSLYSLGLLASCTSRPAEARDLLSRALAIYQRLGIQRMEGACGNQLASLALEAGDLDAARRHTDQSLGLFRALRHPWRVAETLALQASVALKEGRIEAAKGCAAESLVIRQELGFAGTIADSLIILGEIARARGDAPEAAAHFAQGLRLYRDLGHQHGVAVLLCHLGRLALAAGDGETALLLGRQACAMYAGLGLAPEHGDYGEARRLVEEAGAPPPPAGQDASALDEAVEVALAWADRQPGGYPAAAQAQGPDPSRDT